MLSQLRGIFWYILQECSKLFERVKSENTCSGNVVWGSWGAPGVEVGKEGRRLGTRCTWIINFYDSVRFKSYSFCFSMFYSLRRISCFSLLMAFWQLPTAKFKGRPGLSHLQGHALLLPLPTQCTSLYRTISQQHMYTLLYLNKILVQRSFPGC